MDLPYARKNIFPSVLSDLRYEIVEVPANQAMLRNPNLWPAYQIGHLATMFPSLLITMPCSPSSLSLYPNPAILKVLCKLPQCLFLRGVGGGLTKGDRSGNMSLFAESEGSLCGLWLMDQRMPTIQTINKMIDVPIIYTVVSDKAEKSLPASRQEGYPPMYQQAPNGFHRDQNWESYPSFSPLWRQGVLSHRKRRSHHAVGANVTFTPPSNTELFKFKMEEYRLTEERGTLISLQGKKE